MVAEIIRPITMPPACTLFFTTYTEKLIQNCENALANLSTSGREYLFSVLKETEEKTRLDNAGMRVTATNNHRITETEIATPISRNSCPASNSM